MEVRTLRTLPRKVASLSSLARRLRSFSSLSSSSLATESPRKCRFFSDEQEESGSSVYRHALKFQPPSTIKWRRSLVNSVSFIGTVDGPLTRFKCQDEDEIGVYTNLRVETSVNSRGFFKIPLNMWNEMAHISIKHLKENDRIYVSGCLGSYRRVDENGKLFVNYKVTVKDISFVVQCGKNSPFVKSNPSVSEGSRETALEKYKKRIRLWQLFLSNPSEWRDNRRTKKRPNHPDFKHKDTGEALWINASDPPYIKRQLQLHDSRVAAKIHGEDNSYDTSLSPCVYDD